MLQRLEDFLHAYYDLLEATGGPPDKYRPLQAVNEDWTRWSTFGGRGSTTMANAMPRGLTTINAAARFAA
jgi:hypothetical protein